MCWRRMSRFSGCSVRSVTIGNKTVPLTGKGIVYVFASPFAADKLVVIWAGIHYGGEVGGNHKLDLLPDFLFYDDKIDADSTGTNRAICAGFFDDNWKL